MKTRRTSNLQEMDTVVSNIFVTRTFMSFLQSPYENYETERSNGTHPLENTFLVICYSQ